MDRKPVMTAASTSLGAGVEINKVLRNTYMLLGMTLLFSAVTAGVAMALQISQMTALVLSLVGFGLLFVVNKTADSAKGIVAVFAFTGVLGAALGPMLNHYLGMANGPSLIMQALGGTAVVFFALSGYVLTTRKDFSFMGGFLMVGLIVAVVASIALIFFNIPAASMALSALIVLLMSGFILFDTSRIIHGGETNYIRATVSLYLDIYNLFTALLHLLGASSDD
ncbi:MULTISPECIES: Bax inhibitor-1/YccA family protein [Gammaproteobacteria]|uniref:Bax inhibitor-1/YccA family protein n=1 Tax=Gammaproteobacteria TaxID=1236 RepID=UPI001ADD2F32|nr:MULTISPECIES: Bax inhibitor-1/YccA family protein [Gammaproteobacteria]MBO9481329.1 Bax inhibitor-1/YccA family protein [Salinisphaera sp. G21_0]MBO9492522.1 Bax inhibitor-1/YccA family protein [Thalassotalea sp. G20_0]WBA83828.1 Bax inhibitor-1/YccA family protein [Endozoicomonas sp. GU-1]WBA86806.1 Bax inhibitor-1/YccA family protein [Endozoicomonas sp. GU-1]